jgi:hypothetical protein
MPIDPEFPRNQQLIGRHNHADGQHYHFVWGPGSISDAAANEDVRATYAARNEELGPMVYVVLWLQLIGIRVLMMDHVYKYAW